MLSQNNIRLVCLDDDPPGIQNVHSCLLLTEWTDEAIDSAFRDSVPFFYILTNTRAMTRKEAAEVTREAMRAVLRVNERYGYKLIFVSRSDSCLRGHFPLETDVMHEVIREGASSANSLPSKRITFFCPSFIEAGRFTKNGIHYLQDGDRLIPVHESEFARDNVFAYHHSDLHDYIEEKLGTGDFLYHLLSLSDFQKQNAEGQAEMLASLMASISETPSQVFIAIDAADYSHLYNFAAALLEYTKNSEGHIVIRSSSSLPKAISGIDDKPLLTANDLMAESDGGQQKPIFIVGYHVKKTTTQLENLLMCEDTVGIELDIERILNEPDALWQEVCAQLKTLNSQHKTPVVYTSRKEVRLADADQRQRLGQTVSDFLVSIVRRLPYRPSCIIAKGGITSHDILTHGLQIKTARVMGQILSGVPCIRTGSDATFPNLPYIIFPGNVGTETALAEVQAPLGPHIRGEGV